MAHSFKSEHLFLDSLLRAHFVSFLHTISWAAEATKLKDASKIFVFAFAFD